MDPLTGSIVAGAASGGANLLGTILTNEANRKEAKNNRNFQSEMSSSAHQREVADLRAAGLNPILSASGSGASTPSGAQATLENPGSAISTGINTAMAVRQSAAGLENVSADTQNKKVSNSLIANQSLSTAKDVEQKSFQNKLLKDTIGSQIKKLIAEGKYAEANQVMGLVNSGASTANQLLNPFKGIFDKSKTTIDPKEQQLNKELKKHFKVP
ncbi:MAG: DNA pilot protein [Arizlama microvirus]|nr:MAG: DNA pilot protein [Arizlama microvirus]